MFISPTLQSTLAATIWPNPSTILSLRAILLALVGSALLTLSAKIQIPFWPVPMTMQTFAVLVIGITYGSRLGAATVALYLAEGAAGLPVFAGGGGIAYLAGPTAGYLFGFVIAAALVGWLAEHGWDRKASTTAAAMLLGNLVIYVSGLLWLGTLVGYGKVFAVGMLPFLPGDVLKLALAAAILPTVWRFIRQK
jgi:biotin transport system substrate-specific component